MNADKKCPFDRAVIDPSFQPILDREFRCEIKKIYPREFKVKQKEVFQEEGEDVEIEVGNKFDRKHTNNKNKKF